MQLLQAKNEYRMQQQQIQPPVDQQPVIEEIPTSWSTYRVQKASPDAPTFVADEQKAAYDLKARQFVTMQVWTIKYLEIAK